MTRTGHLAVFASVFIAGTLAGRYFLAGSNGKEAVGIILMTAGAFAAVAPSFLAAAISKIDRQPPKELSRYYAERFRRRLSRCRSVFWFRYVVALFCSLIGIAVGGMLKLSSPLPHLEWIIGAGTGAAIVGVSVAVLAIIEFKIVTDVMREVDEMADAIRRKNDLLKPE